MVNVNNFEEMLLSHTKHFLKYFVYLWLFQDFKPPEKPFLRMNYTDAITYLKEHNICKDDGSFYEFGEVSYK